MADCERTVQESIDGLGGLDIIISNAVSFLGDTMNHNGTKFLDVTESYTVAIETGLDQVRSV